jgi:putative transposase
MGRLRDECLNVDPFLSLADANQKLETWRLEHNHHRPHSALGHLPPSEFVTRRQDDDNHHRQLPKQADLLEH